MTGGAIETRGASETFEASGTVLASESVRAYYTDGVSETWEPLRPGKQVRLLDCRKTGSQ